MVELGCGPSVSGVSKVVTRRRLLQVKTKWTKLQSLGAMPSTQYSNHNQSTEETGLTAMSAQIPPPSQQ